MKRFRPSILVASLSCIFAASVAAHGQPLPKLHEGDRVEFSENNACLGTQYAIPKKGVIVKVEPGKFVLGDWTGAYTLQEDPLPGRAPVIVSRPIAAEKCGFRLLGGAAPIVPTDELRVDADGTVLADRRLLDCDHLRHDGRNGSPLPVELAKTLIRCRFEKPSPVGQDGATTMDITSFRVGTPHRWHTYIDVGQGTPDTLVYPVHVRWNMKTFYRARNVQVTDREGTFTCFADAVNLWQCGFAAGPSQPGQTQEIAVKP